MSTITRRSFVQAAGVATAAVAAAGTASALADSASATASEATAADYLNIYADGVVAQPAHVAACPGPRGPIAFESRTIADDEIHQLEAREKYLSKFQICQKSTVIFMKLRWTFP